MLPPFVERSLYLEFLYRWQVLKYLKEGYKEFL
jgi:hypothetical protein